MNEATPAPWPEDPVHQMKNLSGPVDLVGITTADYAHARACVGFVARLEAIVSSAKEQTMLFRLGPAGRFVLDYGEADGSNVVQFADTLTALLAEDVVPDRDQVDADLCRRLAEGGE